MVLLDTSAACLKTTKLRSTFNNRPAQLQRDMQYGRAINFMSMWLIDGWIVNLTWESCSSAACL